MEIVLIVVKIRVKSLKNIYWSHKKFNNKLKKLSLTKLFYFETNHNYTTKAPSNDQLESQSKKVEKKFEGLSWLFVLFVGLIILEK